MKMTTGRLLLSFFPTPFLFDVNCEVGGCASFCQGVSVVSGFEHCFFLIFSSLGVFD